MASSTNEIHILRPADDKELINILQNLADPVKTSSQTSFKREFGLLKAKGPGGGTWACLRDMTPVIQRCCEEKKFWPAAEVEYLITQQCVSPRNIRLVFETLSKRKEVRMIYQALTSQPGKDIPEDCLVIALECFLSTEEKLMQKALDDGGPPDSSRHADDASSCPFSRARCAFVDQVLVAPYDEIYLVSSLKKLPFVLVLDLLKYILHSMRTSQDQKHVDQLALWKGHLIDAHSTQLIISKDAHELLIEFSKEEELNIQFVNHATEDLSPLLKLAMTRNTDKGSRAMGQYCIETLHL
ncbi:nucleolar protein 11-like [Babylonia areolata]|uniref:nucleolar protein 11-like n=1 Tax=Babylonia areolata TaxID=304850 RepID=UPI003FCF762B